MFNVLKKIGKVVFLFYIALYCIVWLLSPTVARYFISDALIPLNLTLGDNTSIRYNPFLSHLSIDDLSLVQNNVVTAPVLTLDELDIEVRLHQLLFDDIHVSEFFIDGLYVKIEKKTDSLIVAGITLPDEEPTEIPQEAKQENEQQSSAPLPYQLQLPELLLNNATIELFINKAAHKLIVNTLTINDLMATLTEQEMQLTIDSKVNNAPLKVSVQANVADGNGELLIDVDLAQMELAHFNQFLPENISQLAGQVGYRANHKIKLNQGDILAKLQNLLVTSDNIAVMQGGMNITLMNQTLSSDLLSIQLPKTQSLVIEGEAQLLLSNMNVYTSSAEQILASFQSLNLDSILFQHTDNVNTVVINTIKLNDFFASDNIANPQIPALARFNSLSIINTQVSEKGIAIDDIILDGLQVDAQLSKDKVLLNLVDMPLTPEVDDEISSTELPENTVKETQEIKLSNKPAFDIALDQFYITNDMNVHFNDHSVQPSYQRHITLTTLTAGAFDSKKPDEEGQFNIVGHSDQYSKIDFKGLAKPFAKIPLYNLNGFMNEVSLPGISSYIKDALGYEIESGQVDLGLTLALTGEEVDGDADVLLRGIQLTGADQHEVSNVKNVTSMPLNIAIGLLKDSDGNVDLSLPLSGNKSDPKFGLSGIMTLFIKQITLSAAKEYVVTTFVPYAKVVSLAVSAGEYALKLRFSDLIFPATISELQPDHQEFLEQFAALMKDKKDTQVKLCPIATPADIGKPVGEITEKTDVESLKNLSLQRIQAFKSVMVEKYGIESSRLLLCKPQINSKKEAQPSITFII
jgi:hypothetical protein